MTMKPLLAALLLAPTLASAAQATFWIPQFGVPAPSQLPTICAAPLPCEVQTRGRGVISLSSVSFGGNKITITNLSPLPFCSQDIPPCSDPFVGFQFVFLNAVSEISVDPASSVDFHPNMLRLLTPTLAVVDVTGQTPASGHRLILDLVRSHD